jgi:hypothetical protein
MTESFFLRMSLCGVRDPPPLFSRHICRIICASECSDSWKTAHSRRRSSSGGRTRRSRRWSASTIFATLEDVSWTLPNLAEETSSRSCSVGPHEIASSAQLLELGFALPLGDSFQEEFVAGMQSELAGDKPQMKPPWLGTSSLKMLRVCPLSSTGSSARSMPPYFHTLTLSAHHRSRFLTRFHNYPHRSSATIQPRTSDEDGFPLPR